MRHHSSEFSSNHAAYLDFSTLKRKYPHAAVLSPKLQETCEALTKLTDIPVLIHGETGTGKGVLAKEIAQCRRQHEGDIPFVALNCAILNNDVADAMLFGHRRGAFTGAHESAIGAVAEADGGVLFLDEIHCLSVGTQRKLLRLLDEGAYTRVGEATERRARFQLIVATNQDLSRLVSRGDFLLDLFMRIQGIEISLPPLRERPQDLPELIALYFANHQLRIRQDDFDRLVALCQPLYWQGNVRQLNKALDAMRFKALIEGGAEYAPYFVVNATMREPVTEEAASRAQPAAPQPAGKAAAIMDFLPISAADADAQPINEVVREILQVRERPIDLARLLESVESALIRYSLNRNGSINDVMDHLSLSRGKLDFKRRKYNLMAGSQPMANGA